MILTAVYWLIVVFFLGLTLVALFREKTVGGQINAVLVIMVLALRALGLK